MDPAAPAVRVAADHPLLGLLPGGRRDAWRPTGPPGLVLLDVDGTLMGPDRIVTPGVVRAVRDVVDAGAHVGFATGRNVAGIVGAHGQLRIEGPHIVLNGAQIRRGGRAVQTWGLDAAHREAVLALCAEQGLYAELYTDDAVLVTEMDPFYKPHWDEVIGQPLGSIAEHPDLVADTIKMTIVALDDAQRDAVVAAVRALGMNAGAATSPVTPGFTYINITAPEADKGRAVVAAAAAIGVGPDRVVAVGDGVNDLPMLEVAGTAVAMGDAPDVVRAAAHHVVPDVAADGAAVALAAVLAWLRSG
jgi:Cof subfamily protein (haloacid dehalogenase superfamily)